jgi:hypothetical protein
MLLLAAKIDVKSGPVRTRCDPALIRNRFMKGRGVGKAGALDQFLTGVKPTRVARR